MVRAGMVSPVVEKVVSLYVASLLTGESRDTSSREALGAEMGANHPAPSTLPGALQKGAGHSVELSAATEVLLIKTYDADEPSPSRLWDRGERNGIDTFFVPP